MPAWTIPSPSPALVSISAFNKPPTICLGSTDKKLFSHLVDFGWWEGGRAWVNLWTEENMRQNYFAGLRIKMISAAVKADAQTTRKILVAVSYILYPL